MGFLAALPGLATLFGGGAAASTAAAATAAKAAALGGTAGMLGSAVLPQAAGAGIAGLLGSGAGAGALGMLSNPLVAMGIGALAPALLGGRERNQAAPDIPEGTSDRRALPAPPMNVAGITDPVAANGLYRPGIDPEPMYFRGKYYAQGGLLRNPTPPIMTRLGPIHMQEGGIASLVHANAAQRQQEQAGQQQLVLEAAKVIRGMSDADPRVVLGRFVAAFGQEALLDLIQRVESGEMDPLLQGEPRMIEGAGDGMSDEVPASIDGQQEVRLSDGEFVIPADVVSGLGNGSSDAGARQLQQMMARVRAARTGTTKQAPEVDPRRTMPV
jgi:hypothetical protein